MPIYLALRTAQKEVETAAAALALNTPLEKMPLDSIVILNGLYQTNGVFISNLAKSLGYHPTSFTPYVDRLEKRGLIKRLPDGFDRRAVRLWVTDRGRDLEPAVNRLLELLDLQFKEWKLG